jgi:hypothetical protein
MKNLIILLFSLLLFSSCQDEEVLQPNTCHCGEIIGKIFSGEYIVKNECSGKTLKFIVISDKDITIEFLGSSQGVKKTYCSPDKKSW